MIVSSADYRAGRVCLSVLAYKKLLVLTPENFSISFSELFKSFSEEQRARCQDLMGRLQPLSSPQGVLTSDPELLSFLRVELAGISADKTFEEAFETKCFRTAVAQPDSRAAFLWHRAHHAIPIDSKEWDSFLNLKRLYELLPLLKNVKVQQLLPEHPVLQEELTYEQLQEAWYIWFSFFGGCLGSVFEVYQEMKEVVHRGSAGRMRNSHLSWHHQNRKLHKFFGNLFQPEETVAFLAKCERLEAFLKKKFPFFRHVKYLKDLFEVDERERFLRQNPILWRAEIFDRIHPIIQLFSEISQLSRVMETRVTEKKRAFESAMKKESLASVTTKEAYADAVQELNEVFVTASAVSLLSQALCTEIRKYLDRILGGPREGRVFQHAEDAIRRALAYHSCVLDDVLDGFEEEKGEERRPVRKNGSQKRSEPQPKLQSSSAPQEESSAVEPQPTALDSLKRQLDVDFEHLESSPCIIGSMAPFAATLAQYIETQTHSQEIGDHLFLMTQGVELFIHCAQNGQSELLPVIFRAVLVDFHVAIERRCVHAMGSLGRPNPHLHDLATLAQASGLTLSESQRKFLQDVNLALYWARYPACSEWYFGNRAKPRLLQMLLDLSEHKKLTSEALSELCGLYQRALELLIPSEVPIERFTIWLQYAAAQPAASPEAPFQIHSSLLLSMRDSIQEVLRTCCYISSNLTRPLREITYYLSWIQQAQILKNLYPDFILRFWHQRNALEVDKLFKHLYTADRLLCDGEEIRSHQVFSMIEALKGIRSFDRPTRIFLHSFNMRTALHYHTHPSPMKETYLNLLKECQLQAHGFTSGEKTLLDWPFFDQAIQLFQDHLAQTLTKFKEANEEMARTARYTQKI